MEAADISLEDPPVFAIKCVRESSHPKHRRQQTAEIRNHNTVARCAHVLNAIKHVEYLVTPLLMSGRYAQSDLEVEGILEK